MDNAMILTYRYKGAEWSLNGDDYEGLTWLSEGSAPTKKQLEDLWPEVQLELATERVEHARAVAYRETADPLFFQYQRAEVTEQVWLDAVQAVKDAHPYPEA
jgi:hypothetical protein